MNPYSTEFSSCRRYRYVWRCDFSGKFGAAPLVVIGLNPSTADEDTRDPTVTRCINYAKAWGFGTLWMLNLFAYRATDPKVMREAADPIGPRNGEVLLTECAEAFHLRAGMILCAWGNGGTYRDRARDVCRLLDQNARVEMHALRVTKANQPQHPLYLPGDLKPFPYHPFARECVAGKSLAVCTCSACMADDEPQEVRS